MSKIAKKLAWGIGKLIDFQNDPSNRTVDKIDIEENDLYIDIYATTSYKGMAKQTMLVGRTYDTTFRNASILSDRYCGETEIFMAEDLSVILRGQLEVLLNRLFALEEWDSVSPDENGKKYAQGLPLGYPSDIAEAAEEFACEELITECGDCNWLRIRELVKKRGYCIYPGDEDSFGWLTGCIEKDGKVLVYG